LAPLTLGAAVEKEKPMRLAPSLCVTVFSLTMLATVTAQAQPFDCKTNQCGLIADGSYPNIIVGQVAAKSSPATNKTMFHWARKKGWWKDLPQSDTQFTQAVLPVAITTQTPKGAQTFTALMGTDEYDTAPIHEGDLVRYSPHGAQHNAPKENTPQAWAYWKLFGCIQILCRQSDAECFKKYRYGVYRKLDGMQVDAIHGVPISGGQKINLTTYLPDSSGR